MSMFADIVEKPITEAESEEAIAKMVRVMVVKERILEKLKEMFLAVNNRNSMVVRVEMNAKDYAVVKSLLGGDALETETNVVLMRKGMMGMLWGASVYVLRCVEEPQVYGQDELPPDDGGVLWVRRGWELPA